MVEETKPEKKKYWVGLVLIAVVAVFWWTKSKTWPIAAVVNYRPIFRYQLEQTLFKQYGSQMADSVITEMLISQELDSRNIKAEAGEIDSKVDEIKAGLGEGQDLETLLGQEGMTMNQLRKNLALKIGVEKAVVEKIAVTEDEIKNWLKDNEAFFPKDMKDDEKTKQAETSLKQEKTQTEVMNWIAELKAKAKIWKFF